MEVGRWRKERGENRGESCGGVEEEREETEGGSGGGGEKKLHLCVSERERRIQSCSLAPGATFLSAMASLSAKCTFDASPHMLL